MFLIGHFYRLTSAFIEVEGEYNLRRLADREQKLAHCFMPPNQSGNDAQNQVPMDNAIESNAENVKMEAVQSARLNPVNLGEFVGVGIESLLIKFRVS